MTEQHDTNMAIAKVAIAWLGAAIGGVTLSGLVLGATLVFTLLNIYVLIRKVRRENRLEKLEAKLKHEDGE